MTDDSFNCEPAHDANVDLLSINGNIRTFFGKFDIQKCQDGLDNCRPKSGIDRIVQALLVANLGIKKCSLSDMIRDISDHTIYFRFFDGNSFLNSGKKSDFWFKANKSDFKASSTIQQSTLLVRMISQSLLQYLSRKDDVHPLLSAYLRGSNHNTNTSLSGAHRRFILNEISFYLFGEKAHPTVPSAPAPWTTQFLLFSAGHIYEACNAIMPRAEMVNWSNYVHTHVLDICKELSRDFPFSPWGEKLFFYYHLIAADLSSEAKKVLMGYWNFHVGNQPEICEILNSAWRTLQDQEKPTGEKQTKISAAEVLASKLSEAIASPESTRKWFGDESYRGDGIKDINQFVRDLSKLKIDKKSNPINFGRFFSSEN